MKKSILFLFSLLSMSLNLLAQEGPEFKVHFSEIYATYDFLIKISDNYPENDLKSIYSNSKYNTAFYKKQITDFEKIRLNYTYSYDQYPLPLKVAMMSVDLLEKNLATSSNLQEFKAKSVGIIPNEDLISLSQVLENFLPVYQNIVAKPNETAIEIQKKNLLRYVNNNRFSEFFKVGLSFYNTKWDKSLPFHLNLLPSLDNGNLGARTFFNVAVCEASLGLEDHKTFFSVAMHEIYHIIYDNQSLEVKKNLQHWFDNTNSFNSQYALLLLNEVLATALGNAFVMHSLNGKIAEYDWYENKYISEMAKIIYPTVQQYVGKKKSIDEEFVKKYVHLYDSRFSDWNNELAHLFMYRYLIADTKNDLLYFKKAFKFYSNTRTSGNLSLVEIEKAKEYPLTKAFIISVDHKRKLAFIKSCFNELKDIKMNYTNEFIKVFTLKDRTKLFIINRYKSSVEQMMKYQFPDGIIK